jgi:hypothetical protein
MIVARLFGHRSIARPESRGGERVEGNRTRARFLRCRSSSYRRVSPLASPGLKSFPTSKDERPAKRAFHGGGGNRTRVRSRTGLGLYRCSSPFALAPPAGGERPTAGASHPVVSPLRRSAFHRGQPVYDAATRTTGRIRSDASPNYLGGECEIVIRTYVGSRLFYEADRGPRPAAQPENRPRRDLVAPVCSFPEL